MGEGWFSQIKKGAVKVKNMSSRAKQDWNANLPKVQRALEKGGRIANILGERLEIGVEGLEEGYFGREKHRKKK